MREKAVTAKIERVPKNSIQYEQFQKALARLRENIEAPELGTFIVRSPFKIEEYPLSQNDLEKELIYLSQACGIRIIEDPFLPDGAGRDFPDPFHPVYWMPRKVIEIIRPGNTGVSHD